MLYGKKLLGIDYGARTVGVAITDESGEMAFPRDPFENNNDILSHIIKLAEEEKVGFIVVGDTRAFSGLENQITPEADIFIKKLEELSMVPVVRASEAGTSQEAARFAPHNDRHNDSVAAALILQRYIDMHPHSDTR